MNTIKKGKFVEVCYELTTGVDDNFMESVPKERPLGFVFGYDQMIDDFEKNLEGFKAGDKFDFRISSAAFFGDYDETLVHRVPKGAFYEDGIVDDSRILIGELYDIESENGHVYSGKVLDIKEDCVLVDFNHPLAGETLNFKGEVVAVRDATDDEIEVAKSHGCCGCCSNCSNGCSENDCGGECCI